MVISPLLYSNFVFINYISPAFFKINVSSCSVILKLVALILDIIGFIDGIIPASFASTIIPIVPMITMPNCWANFLPLRSSIISKQSFNSIAKAIALASPLSTDASIII